MNNIENYLFSEVEQSTREYTFMMNSIETENSPDWGEVWRRKKAAQRYLKGYGQGGGFWEDRKFVKKFAGSRQEKGSSEIADKIAAMDIRPGDRVLDIGAGPGSFAVPLAASGCEVTAVEPSARMRQVLEEYAEREGVDGIRLIASRWEDVETDILDGPYDVVIASFSLVMDDIVDAARKMDAVGRRNVYLFWFLTPLSWVKVLADLWPQVHGCEYVPGPTADILWNALIQSGIYANIVVKKAVTRQAYRDMDEAAEAFMFRLRTDEEEHANLVRDYAERMLLKSERGLEVPVDSWNALIWWKK
jgi:ubiquinone/menaquinone biosynthesis C-methylase UbiE